MATALQLPALLEPQVPRRKVWTRQDCARLQDVIDLERYELIEGELFEKVSKNHPHSLTLLLLAEWLRDVFGRLVVVQEPGIDVAQADNPTSEPEPDLIVLNRSFRDLAPRPRPEDILLLVEISDSTLKFDLTVKRDLYARAAIPEYWVVDVNSRQIIVHRHPVAGRYRSTVEYGETEQVTPLAAPEHSSLVRDLL